MKTYSLLIVSKELGNSAVDKYLPHVKSLLSDEEILKSQAEVEFWLEEITNKRLNNIQTKSTPKL